MVMLAGGMGDGERKGDQWGRKREAEEQKWGIFYFIFLGVLSLY
jgi:hypothetical protein